MTEQLNKNNNNKNTHLSLCRYIHQCNKMYLLQEMVTHCILAWRIPMARGTWWATIYEVAQKSDTTQQLNNNTFNTYNHTTSWQQPCRLFPSSVSAPPSGWLPALWSVRFCSRLTRLMSTLKLSEQTVTCFPERKEVQGSLGDIGGSVPEHQNVVNITIKSVIQYFWFPRVYRSYVQTTLQPRECAVALCLRKQCTDLNLKNNLLLMGIPMGDSC